MADFWQTWLLVQVAKDDGHARSRYSRTAPKQSKARESRTPPLRQTDGTVKADSYRSDLLAWLRSRFRREDNTTAQITKTAMQASPASHSSAPQQPDQTRLSRPDLYQQQDTMGHAIAPPAYDYQGALPPLDAPRAPPPLDASREDAMRLANLPREDEIEVTRVVHLIMTAARPSIRKYDSATSTTIEAAVREGCITVAATICKVTRSKTAAELSDIIHKGCSKVIQTLIALVSTLPQKNRKNVSRGAIQCIEDTAEFLLEYNKTCGKSFIAAARLKSTVNFWAAANTLCTINQNRVLEHLPLLAPEEFQ